MLVITILVAVILIGGGLDGGDDGAVGGDGDCVGAGGVSCCGGYSMLMLVVMVC